jgi:hypothetical protein
MLCFHWPPVLHPMSTTYLEQPASKTITLTDQTLHNTSQSSPFGKPSSAHHWSKANRYLRPSGWLCRTTSYMSPPPHSTYYLHIDPDSRQPRIRFMRCNGSVEKGEYIWRERDKGRERVQVCGSLCFRCASDRRAMI